MVCGEELPAQWQNLPLKTRLEIQAGRKALGAEEVKRVTIARWANEGELYLQSHFAGRDVAFNTMCNLATGEITLQVFHVVSGENKQKQFKLLFEETCPAELFVQAYVVTKIMMVC